MFICVHKFGRPGKAILLEIPVIIITYSPIHVPLLSKIFVDVDFVCCKKAVNSRILNTRSGISPINVGDLLGFAGICWSSWRKVTFFAAPDILLTYSSQAVTFHTFYTYIIISCKLYSFRL